MLRELSVTEQRYRAVLEVLEVLEEHATVVEVAALYCVTRQSVHHHWVRRYLDALADRSHRPHDCPTRSARRWRPGSVSCAASTPAGGHDGWSTSLAANSKATWICCPRR